MTVKRDKLLHAETTALILLSSCLFLPYWIGLIIAITASIGKELWDKTHNGVASWKDLIADGVGILLGTVIYLLSTVL